jgi:hypothetical protein
METAGSFKVVVLIYQTTQRYVLEDRKFIPMRTSTFAKYYLCSSFTERQVEGCFPVAYACVNMVLFFVMYVYSSLLEVVSESQAYVGP